MHTTGTAARCPGGACGPARAGQGCALAGRAGAPPGPAAVPEARRAKERQRGSSASGAAHEIGVERGDGPLERAAKRAGGAAPRPAMARAASSWSRAVRRAPRQARPHPDPAGPPPSSAAKASTKLSTWGPCRTRSRAWRARSGSGRRERPACRPRRRSPRPVEEAELADRIGEIDIRSGVGQRPERPAVRVRGRPARARPRWHRRARDGVAPRS